MEISKKDNTSLTEIFNTLNNQKYLECEIVINKEIYFDNYVNILNVIKNITNNDYEESETLDISFNDNIRTSIIGNNSILQYCKHNDIEKINKDNVIETYKSKIVDKSFKFDNDDKIKVNLKNEVNINELEKDNNIYLLEDEELQLKLNKEYNKHKKVNFNEDFKYYRYKKRSSIHDKNNNFRFDFTILKESDGNSIYNSNLFNKNEKYELEIEYIGKIENYNEFRKNILVYTTNILRAIMDSYFITNNKEEEIVKDIYIKYIKSLYKKNLEEVIKYKENNNIKITKFKKDILSKAFKKTSITKIKKELNNIENKNIKDYLLNPKPITLNLSNLYKDKDYNILNNFSVTDKADGESMLIYVLGLDHLTKKEKDKYEKYNGNIYLIDMNYLFLYIHH